MNYKINHSTSFHLYACYTHTSVFHTHSTMFHKRSADVPRTFHTSPIWICYIINCSLYGFQLIKNQHCVMFTCIYTHFSVPHTFSTVFHIRSMHVLHNRPCCTRNCSVHTLHRLLHVLHSLPRTFQSVLHTPHTHSIVFHTCSTVFYSH